MDNIHLVFEPSLASALEQELVNVAGKDVTLEQFSEATKAGIITADVAIVDGVLGVVNKQDSIRLLKDIRIHAPTLRLIVILPLEADKDWIRSLGNLGIYDVYRIESFDLEDVKSWIANKKTLADVFPDDSDVTGPVEGTLTVPVQESGIINKFLHRWTERRDKNKTTGEVVKDEEVHSSNKDLNLDIVNDNILNDSRNPDENDEPKKKMHNSEDDIVPTVHNTSFLRLGVATVAIGGIKGRSGTTHTAIQVATLLANMGLKIAFVEYQLEEKVSDIVSFTSSQDGDMFSYKKVDFFPNRNPLSMPEILSLDYDVVVLDLGSLFQEKNNQLEVRANVQEFLRSAVRILTLGASPWDVHFAACNWKDIMPLAEKGSVVVNYADKKMFNDLSDSFSAFKIKFILNELKADPFGGSEVLFKALKNMVPKGKKWGVV